GGSLAAQTFERAVRERRPECADYRGNGEEPLRELVVPGEARRRHDDVAILLEKVDFVGRHGNRRGRRIWRIHHFSLSAGIFRPMTLAALDGHAADLR